MKQNTPLSVIMGNIEMFEMEFGKNKYLSNIEVAMKNIFSIYDDLSYLVKKDQVNQASHKIDLVDFIRARIDFFSSSEIEFHQSLLSFFLNSIILFNIETSSIVDNH